MKKTISILFFTLIYSVCWSQKEVEFYNSAVAKEESSDLIGAILDYNKSLEINPQYANAYFYRGMSKINVGQKENGCLDLSKAGELGYDNAYEKIKEYCMSK